MPRPKEYDCSVCKVKHARPVGRNCTRSRDAASSSSLLDSTHISEISASSKSGSSGISDDLAQKILQSLNNVNERLDTIDKRIQKNEEVMAAKLGDDSLNSPLTSPENQGASALIARNSTLKSKSKQPHDSVVPTLDFVRSNEDL